MNETLTKEQRDKILNGLIEVEEDKSKTKYAFYSKLTPVILAFLGLLVSLKSGDNLSNSSELFFFSTILLLGLCVLCSVIVQYSELHYAHQKVVDYKKKGIEYVLGKSESKSINVTIKVSPFFSVVEIMTIVFLGLSILSLVIYSYVLTFCK